jgi:hypothetical protein
MGFPVVFGMVVYLNLPLEIVPVHMRRRRGTSRSDMAHRVQVRRLFLGCGTWLSESSHHNHRTAQAPVHIAEFLHLLMTKSVEVHRIIGIPWQMKLDQSDFGDNEKFWSFPVET